YFRKTAVRESVKAALLKVVLPGLGGVLLIVTFVQTTIDSFDPEFGSGTMLFGLGLVGVLGVVVLLIGVALMLLWSRKAPDFFHGKVIARGDDSDGEIEVFDDTSAAVEH